MEAHITQLINNCVLQLNNKIHVSMYSIDSCLSEILLSHEAKKDDTEARPLTSSGNLTGILKSERFFHFCSFQFCSINFVLLDLLGRAYCKY